MSCLPRWLSPGPAISTDGRVPLIGGLPPVSPTGRRQRRCFASSGEGDRDVSETRNQGTNVVMLWSASVVNGYACPIWLAFKQAQQLGGNVRKGKHGELVVYADRITRTETDAKVDEVERLRSTQERPRPL